MVGDFNHWNPAAHPLQSRGDGTRAAQISLPAHSSHSFRYLAAGDHWFNDHHDSTDSRIHTWSRFLAAPGHGLSGGS